MRDSHKLIQAESHIRLLQELARFSNNAPAEILKYRDSDQSENRFKFTETGEIDMDRVQAIVHESMNDLMYYWDGEMIYNFLGELDKLFRQYNS